MITAEKQYAYEVQNLVSGELSDVHVANTRFYADRAMNVTVATKDVFQHTFRQGFVEMLHVLGFAQADGDERLLVLVDWIRFN